MIVEQVDITTQGAGDPVDHVTRVRLEVSEEYLIDLLVQEYNLGHVVIDAVKLVQVLLRKGGNPGRDRVLCLHKQTSADLVCSLVGFIQLVYHVLKVYKQIDILLNQAFL